MKYWLTLAVISAAHFVSVSSQACSAGSYRCSSPSGQGTAFLQCDVGGVEVQKSCAPGTVCYTQGSSILCSYPVDTASQLPPASGSSTSGSSANEPPVGGSPASGSLVAGAQCSFVSPFDEYMCPGANGQHNYFLRCLSGTFVHFACPPGTACIKNEGQNMFCGWPSKGAAGPAPNTDNTPPTIDSGESTGKSSSVIDIGGSASESSPVIDVGGSTSESSPVIDIGGSTSETSPVIDIGGSTSEGLPDIDIGGSTSDGLPDITTGGETSEGLPDIDTGSSAEEDTSSTHGLFDDLPPLFPSTPSDIDTGVDASGEISLSSADSTKLEEPTTESAADTAEASQSESLSAEAPPSIQDTSDVQPTATKHNSGLSGPVISSGLEMLLQNGVQLPFTLPNIDLPEINLATVHLPDMTFDGIAITGIPLPSVTIPPMNPASLTNFNYIEEIMSKAGITFDDLANLPLPDLNNLNLSDLGHIDVASVMSIMNVNRISVQDGVSAQNLAETLPPATDAPHTTTLDADGIDALLGLSVMTYSSV